MLEKTLIAWDIENIGFKYYDKILQFIPSINEIDGFYVHNIKNIPIKPEQSNFLRKQGWTEHLVKLGKNSADSKISDTIRNEVKKYKTFILISSDYGFSNIIIHLLNHHKQVTLLCDDKNTKLLNKIYAKYNQPNINELLTIINLD